MDNENLHIESDGRVIIGGTEARNSLISLCVNGKAALDIKGNHPIEMSFLTSNFPELSLKEYAQAVAKVLYDFIIDNVTGMAEEKLHDCEGKLPDDAYGEAIEYCNENEKGELWIGNSEYFSQVAFCPYCGFESKEKPIIKKG